MGEMIENTKHQAEEMSCVYISYPSTQFGIKDELVKILNSTDVKSRIRNLHIESGMSLKEYNVDVSEAHFIIVIVDSCYLMDYDCMQVLYNIIKNASEKEIVAFFIKDQDTNDSVEDCCIKAEFFWREKKMEHERQLVALDSSKDHWFMPTYNTRKDIVDFLGDMFTILPERLSYSLPSSKEHAEFRKDCLKRIVMGSNVIGEIKAEFEQIANLALPTSTIPKMSNEPNNNKTENEYNMKAENNNKAEISYCQKTASILKHLISEMDDKSLSYRYDELYVENDSRNIEDYAHIIGRSNLVVAIIGKDYIESLACMKELLYVYQNGRLEEVILYIAVQTPNFNLFDNQTIEDAHQFWTKKFEEENTKLNSIDEFERSNKENDDRKITRSIRDSVRSILSDLKKIIGFPIKLNGSDYINNEENNKKIEELMNELETRQGLSPNNTSTSTDSANNKFEQTGKNNIAANNITGCTFNLG